MRGTATKAIPTDKGRGRPMVQLPHDLEGGCPPKRDRGGLVEQAHHILGILSGCHMAAGGVRAGVLPPEPPSCGEGKLEHRPDDLQTLLNEIMESAQVLNKELTELHRVVSG